MALPAYYESGRKYWDTHDVLIHENLQKRFSLEVIYKKAPGV